MCVTGDFLISYSRIKTSIFCTQNYLLPNVAIVRFEKISMGGKAVICHQETL